jgi:hypothetical protein
MWRWRGCYSKIREFFYALISSHLRSSAAEANARLRLRLCALKIATIRCAQAGPPRFSLRVILHRRRASLSIKKKMREST